MDRVECHLAMDLPVICNLIKIILLLLLAVHVVRTHLVIIKVITFELVIDHPTLL